MTNKSLYLIATFDEDTSRRMDEITDIIKREGIIDKQTPDIPHHITLASFNISHEQEVKQLLQGVCATTKRFDLSFNHIGLFGLKVMFLGPDVNYELLQLHKSFDKYSIKSSRGWTAHATILINDEENILKALPIVANKFDQINSKVENVSLYEFFPKRLIAQYNLQ